MGRVCMLSVQHLVDFASKVLLFTENTSLFGRCNNQCNPGRLCGELVSLLGFPE